jgi:hypothetical protein
VTRIPGAAAAAVLLLAGLAAGCSSNSTPTRSATPVVAPASTPLLTAQDVQAALTKDGLCPVSNHGPGSVTGGIPQSYEVVCTPPDGDGGNNYEMATVTVAQIPTVISQRRASHSVTGFYTGTAPGAHFVLSVSVEGKPNVKTELMGAIGSQLKPFPAAD